MRQHILSKTCQYMGDSLPIVVHTSARSAAAIIVCLLAITAIGQRALADVRLDGNVLLDDGDEMFYGEDPFTTANDGIPLGGNIIEGFRLFDQVRYEGRVDDKDTPATGDDENINFHIIVGQNSSGQMSILGGSDLRDMHLIIGDSAEGEDQVLRGTGTVRISGEGSLYNNNPFINPFFPAPFDPADPRVSVNPRQDHADAGMGFDLWVGRNGIGTLEISAGGRAEIQDAVLVGDQTGSIGTLIVDGIDSFLSSGGFPTESAANDERHEMIIGRLGNGTMSITNGATVYALGPRVTGANRTVVAAVIGSNRPSENVQMPELAGQGTVVVDGLGSLWLLGGTLEIGGFHNALNDSDGESDMEGDDAFYPAFTGHGTLNISDGGLVSVVSPVPDGEDDQPLQLDVAIGHFGTLSLDGGSLEIQPPTTETGQTDNRREIQNFRLINDGTILGSGNILVGQFRNRALGEVRVDSGQKLIVAATGQFDGMAADDEQPLQNFGLIEVLGNAESRAELEFVRSPSTLSNETVAPFLNQRHGTVTGNGGRSQGDIVAQHAILRFRSGIENHGNVTFTAGDNVVSGDFVNSAPTGPGDPGGVVFIGGNNTTVTFEDGFFNSGIFDLGPNASLVTALEDFAMGGSGSLSLTLGGSGSGQQVSHLSVMGDLMLDGLLEISLFASATSPLAPQAGDTFEIMRALGEMTGDFAAFNLPFVSPTVGLFAFPDFTLDAYFITAIGFDPANGPDFNGDGVVDDTDLDIWRQNLGNPGGLGDANDDGIVDAVDFFIWQMAAAVPGAGSGAGFGLTGAVPEPSSCLLLAFGSLLALAHRRRK